MTFSLYFLLIPYAIFLVIWFFLSMVGLYHLIRFSGRHTSSFVMGLVYVIGSVVILTISYIYLAPISWSQPATIFGSLGPSPSFIDFDY
jgi:hypothetical protein